MRPAYRFGVRLAVGVLLLSLILRRVSWDGLDVEAPSRLALGVGSGLLFLLAGQGLAALRWKILLGNGSPPWSHMARLYLIGAAFSLFLPTVVGGDAVRAAAMAHTTKRTGSAIASVLLDRVFGVAAMVGYLALGLVAAPELARSMLGRAEWRLPGGIPVLLGAILALCILSGIIVSRSGRLRDMIRQGWVAVTDVGHSPSRAISAMVLGFAVQGLYIAQWIVLAAVMQFDVPRQIFLIAVPLVTLATMLPISLAGLGLREGAWLLALRPQGIPAVNIVTYSLMYFAANLLLGALGGLLFLFKGTGTGPRPSAPLGP